MCHLYNDRGCEIMNTDIERHKEILSHFLDWEVQAKS
ncbi:DUF3885 domain-containing protein [Ureibacillus sinduriensis]